MAEKDTIFKGRIKQKGIYNFKDFYEFLYDYFTDEYKDKCSIQAYWNYYIGEKHIVANLKTEKLYERRPETTN